jgi:NDP-sugar pyrophosphorylase family protein
MNIIIPAAGKGQRFIDAGFKTPKPFIEPLGNPFESNLNLLETAIISCCDVPNIKFHIIVNKDHKSYIENLNTQEKFENYHNITNLDINYIYIDKLTSGAAETCLKVKDFINNNDPLLIINSDQFIDDAFWLNRLIINNDFKKADGSIVCFPNNHPKWSYIKIQDGVITQVKEKEPISEFATVGAYYWTKGSDFVWSAEEMMNKNIRVNNEFYVAPSYNELIIKGKKIVPFFINSFWPLGTPEDLRKFEEDHDKRKNLQFE